MDNNLIKKSELEKFGDDYIKMLTRYLLKYKKKASGHLIKSLDYRIQIVANEAKIILEADDYLKNVDEGRRKGSYPPIQDITKWARLKGISQDAVYPIAKSIFKFGIKPTNIIQQAMKEIESSSAYQRRYEEVFAKNIEDRIYNIITTEIKK